MFLDKHLWKSKRRCAWSLACLLSGSLVFGDQQSLENQSTDEHSRAELYGKHIKVCAQIPSVTCNVNVLRRRWSARRLPSEQDISHQGALLKALYRPPVFLLRGTFGSFHLQFLQWVEQISGEWRTTPQLSVKKQCWLSGCSRILRSGPPRTPQWVAGNSGPDKQWEMRRVLAVHLN